MRGKKERINSQKVNKYEEKIYIEVDSEFKHRRQLIKKQQVFQGRLE